MNPVQKKQSSGIRPLRPKLPLRNKTKQPPLQSQPQPPRLSSTPSKLTKEFIISHATFWKQSPSANPFSQIQSLVLSDLSLNSFESTATFPIISLTNISLLSLSKNNITSLHPLAQLDTLISLNLNNNQIFDLSPLSFLQKLQSLYLNNNKINNIQPLYDLYNLKNLHLYNNLLPYRDKLAIQEFVGSRLVEIDIDKNDVFKEEEKNDWLAGGKTLRKFNGEPVSVKMKNEIIMNSTSQTFRPFSSMVMSRPSTALSARGSEDVSGGLQGKVEELERVYRKLDNQYEEEIVNNVRLKEELREKEKRKRVQEEKGEEGEELLGKVEGLRREVDGLKEGILGDNPELKELYELTVKYEKYKLSMLRKQQKENKNVEPTNQVKYNNKQQYKIPQYEQKPFHADQQLVFDSDDDEQNEKYEQPQQRKYSNSDDELEEILRRNEEELTQLKAELNLLK